MFRPSGLGARHLTSLREFYISVWIQEGTECLVCEEIMLESYLRNVVNFVRRPACLKYSMIYYA